MDDKTLSNENKENETNSNRIKDYEEFFNSRKLRFLPSINPNITLKSLATPRFLGSYHIKQPTDPRFNTFSNLMKGNLEMKYAKALRRNAILNPVTIALIIIAIVFNIFWFFLI